MSDKSEIPATKAIVEIPDLWVMVLATVRYAMGRRSYMPSLAIEFVERYRKFLTEHQFNQILDEISSELGRLETLDSTLGDKIDHETWKAFVAKYRSF